MSIMSLDFRQTLRHVLSAMAFLGFVILPGILQTAFGSQSLLASKRNCLGAAGHQIIGLNRIFQLTDNGHRLQQIEQPDEVKQIADVEKLITWGAQQAEALKNFLEKKLGRAWALDLETLVFTLDTYPNHQVGAYFAQTYSYAIKFILFSKAQERRSSLERTQLRLINSLQMIASESSLRTLSEVGLYIGNSPQKLEFLDQSVSHMSSQYRGIIEPPFSPLSFLYGQRDYTSLLQPSDSIEKNGYVLLAKEKQEGEKFNDLVWSYFGKKKPGVHQIHYYKYRGNSSKRLNDPFLKSLSEEDYNFVLHYLDSLIGKAEKNQNQELEVSFESIELQVMSPRRWRTNEADLHQDEVVLDSEWLVLGGAAQDVSSLVFDQSNLTSYPLPDYNFALLPLRDGDTKTLQGAHSGRWRKKSGLGFFRFYLEPR